MRDMTRRYTSSDLGEVAELVLSYTSAAYHNNSKFRAEFDYLASRGLVDPEIMFALGSTNKKLLNVDPETVAVHLDEPGKKALNTVEEAIVKSGSNDPVQQAKAATEAVTKLTLEDAKQIDPSHLVTVQNHEYLPVEEDAPSPEEELEKFTLLHNEIEAGIDILGHILSNTIDPNRARDIIKGLSAVQQFIKFGQIASNPELMKMMGMGALSLMSGFIGIAFAIASIFIQQNRPTSTEIIVGAISDLADYIGDSLDILNQIVVDGFLRLESLQIEALSQLREVYKEVRRGNYEINEKLMAVMEEIVHFQKYERASDEARIVRNTNQVLRQASLYFDIYNKENTVEFGEEFLIRLFGLAQETSYDPVIAGLSDPPEIAREVSYQSLEIGRIFGLVPNMAQKIGVKLSPIAKGVTKLPNPIFWARSANAWLNSLIIFQLAKDKPEEVRQRYKVGLRLLRDIGIQINEYAASVSSPTSLMKAYIAWKDQIPTFTDDCMKWVEKVVGIGFGDRNLYVGTMAYHTLSRSRSNSPLPLRSIEGSKIPKATPGVGRHYRTDYWGDDPWSVSPFMHYDQDPLYIAEKVLGVIQISEEVDQKKTDELNKITWPTYKRPENPTFIQERHQRKPFAVYKLTINIDKKWKAYIQKDSPLDLDKPIVLYRYDLTSPLDKLRTSRTHTGGPLYFTVLKGGLYTLDWKFGVALYEKLKHVVPTNTFTAPRFSMEFIYEVIVGNSSSTSQDVNHEKLTLPYLSGTQKNFWYGEGKQSFVSARDPSGKVSNFKGPDKEDSSKYATEGILHEISRLSKIAASLQTVELSKKFAGDRFQVELETEADFGKMADYAAIAKTFSAIASWRETGSFSLADDDINYITTTKLLLAITLQSLCRGLNRDTIQTFLTVVERETGGSNSWDDQLRQELLKKAIGNFKNFRLKRLAYLELSKRGYFNNKSLALGENGIPFDRTNSRALFRLTFDLRRGLDGIQFVMNDGTSRTKVSINDVKKKRIKSVSMQEPALSEFRYNLMKSIIGNGELDDNGLPDGSEVPLSNWSEQSEIEWDLVPSTYSMSEVLKVFGDEIKINDDYSVPKFPFERFLEIPWSWVPGEYDLKQLMRVFIEARLMSEVRTVLPPNIAESVSDVEYGLSKKFLELVKDKLAASTYRNLSKQLDKAIEKEELYPDDIVYWGITNI